MAECGGETEFELRIVCRNENFTFVGDETVADALSVFAANGDILEIWVNATETASGGDVLCLGGVDAIILVSESREWRDVGTE